MGPKLAAWARRAGGSLTWQSEQRKVSLFLSSGISALLQFVSLPPAPFPDVFCSPRRAGGGVRGGVERWELSVLMMWIWDLDKTQPYLLCDLRKVSNSSAPSFLVYPVGIIMNML